MRKQKPETTEYTPNWDSGTYQTGSTTPPKEHRGLIAVLMIIITFLGGLASTLGLLNVRLLLQLAQADAPADTVALYQGSTEDALPKPQQDIPAPSVPEETGLDIRITESEDSGEQVFVSEEQILGRNSASIVSIRCDSWEAEEQICGVIMDEDGYILTNAYPVSDSSHIYVTLSDGRHCRAALVGTDEFTDLAVLYIDLSGLTAAEFATTDTLEDGDFAACITADQQLIQGTVCCASFDYTISSQTLKLLQTDLSGMNGPVYNHSGQIIGFGSQYFSLEGNHLAVPSMIVKDVAEQIIANGYYAGRPCLGVEIEEVQMLYQHYWQLPSGLRVINILSENTVLSGLEPGDILICLHGRAISDRASLCSVLRNFAPGDRVEAVVLRGDAQITLTLTIHAAGSNAS